jgi:hypothetical protein
MTNLKPFDLEAAKRGEPVCTRDGRAARIICFDYKDHNDSIVALVSDIDGDEDVMTCNYNGLVFQDCEAEEDLFMAPKKKTYYLNIYREENGRIFSGNVYSARGDDISYASLVKTLEFDVEE